MSFRKTINMELSTESIDRAIQEIQKIRQKLTDCCNDLVRALTETGVTVAKMNVMSMNAVYTGALEESIDGVFFPEERLGVVFADVPYALYVEYGTGIVGEMTPNDNPEGNVEWEYDIHEHRESGWWYFSNADGFGRFRWTKGMPARPYMYNTLRWLQENAPRIAGSMFSNM